MDLESALDQFDAAEATLRRLENVWEEMRQIIPAGASFSLTESESQRYEELRRAFGDLATGLPVIEGWRIADEPSPLRDIAQDRIDAKDSARSAQS